MRVCGSVDTEVAVAFGAHDVRRKKKEVRSRVSFFIVTLVSELAAMDDE